jgi:hypothetical protein
MGESRPSKATASDSQLLAEQPGKDLSTMGPKDPPQPSPGRSRRGIFISSSLN